MRRFSSNINVLLGLGFLALGAAGTAHAEDFSFHHENVMGTALELKVRADTEAAALGAESSVLREIDRLSAIFSTYDPASELSRWHHASGPVRVSSELFALFEASDRWSAASGGAFDPRVDALTRLWSSAAKRDRVPSADELASARATLRPAAWKLDRAARTAERLSSCPLTLNAIAKGFIVDRACAAALDPERGVRGLLLNVGGDLHARGEPLGPIGIASPTADSETTGPIAAIEVRDRSVATSGNYHRGFRIGGRWYSHIFDPRSGMPAESVVSATVIAERGDDADALATIFNVLTVAESLRLAASIPGVECLIISRDGTIARSAGWARYERPVPRALMANVVEGLQDAPRNTLGDEFEVVVRFEINSPSGTSRRYRRPYIAVWVEDKDGALVRTLVLWIQRKGRSQWVADLKRWHRLDQARLLVDKTDVKGTLSRATRSPGKYDVVWDGKDDRGKSLPPGAYTISIEAAREHGTYQSIRKTVTLANQPFVEDLKGNVEIKSASIEYRRTGAKQ